MKNKKILVISAHPDDLDFGCSGTMALYSKDNEIHYVLCTSGEKGIMDDIPIRSKRKIREKEQEEAARIVGVRNVIFLRENDGEVENNVKFKKKLVKAIRQVKPDIIFSMDPSMHKFDNFYLYHPDHRAVSHAVFDSVYPAVGNRLFFPDLFSQGYKPHKIEEVYFFATNEPNFWVDITKYVNKKIKALACHKSQIKDIKSLGFFIKEMASDIGKKKGMKYAEAFRKLEVP